jgi:hypothetical protein
LQAAQRAALPVLLLGLLFLLPLVAGILPSWLAGRPPLFVTPAAALEDAPARDLLRRYRPPLCRLQRVQLFHLMRVRRKHRQPVRHL